MSIVMFFIAVNKMVLPEFLISLGTQPFIFQSN